MNKPRLIRITTVQGSLGKLQEDLKNSLGIYPNDFINDYLGRLVKDKGINELIESFSKINYCNVILLLVGGFETDLDPLKKKQSRK